MTVPQHLGSVGACFNSHLSPFTLMLTWVHTQTQLSCETEATLSVSSHYVAAEAELGGSPKSHPPLEMLSLT